MTAELEDLFDDSEEPDSNDQTTAPGEATEGKEGAAGATGKIVLVVDDSRLIRVAMRKIVEAMGHEVIEASDGAEAIVQAMGRVPDMIFLDWVMPEKDGLEVLVQLRKMPQTAGTPVCLLTAEMDIAQVRQAAKYKVKDYLSKPAHHVHVQQKVEKYLG